MYCSVHGNTGESWHYASIGLCSSCKPNLVIAQIINGIVLPEEYITQDPERLSILRRQVGRHDANSAVATVLLKVKTYIYILQNYTIIFNSCNVPHAITYR